MASKYSLICVLTALPAAIAATAFAASWYGTATEATPASRAALPMSVNMRPAPPPIFARATDAKESDASPLPPPAEMQTVPDTPIRYDFAVDAIDPAARQEANSNTGVPNRHLVLVPSKAADRRQRLFVFIGGTGSAESMTEEIVRAGARRGYHSIALAYPNYDAVGVLCLASLDSECSAKVREEILTGVDLTPLVTIATADAFETRLQRLLSYLAVNHPDEGWQNFISDGVVDWSKISAVGHSQGAGHVAYLAKRHAMLRAVMISGVADITAAAQPAPWLYRTNVTPVDRQYGFSHLLDLVVPFVVANRSWAAIGLDTFGPVRSVDNLSSPYGGSHRLTTAKAPASGLNPHVSIMADASMPRNADGSPAYEPVWTYMAFPD